MSVLPLARTGTGVSSPCRRSAASTWSAIRSCKRPERHRAGPDLVGQRRQAEIDAFAGVAVALAVQRLVLAVLLEHDRRQQVGARPAPGRCVERRRRLRYLLARPAGELLAHRLDHLPAARDNLQRLGHVLADLRQLLRTAARARCRRRNNHPARAAGPRETACGQDGGGRAPSPPWCRSRHARPPARPPSRSPRARRAGVQADPAGALCAPSAARTAPAGASRPSASGRAISAAASDTFASAFTARASAATRAVFSAAMLDPPVIAGSESQRPIRRYNNPCGRIARPRISPRETAARSEPGSANPSPPAGSRAAPR